VTTILVLAGSGVGVSASAALEAVGAATELTAAAGGGRVVVAALAPEPAAVGDALSVSGVDEIVGVSTSGSFEGHVAEALVLALLDTEQPDIVLAAHTVDCIAYVAAVALHAGAGFASDVTGLAWEGGLRASRGLYGDKLVAELAFDASPTILMLRGGSFRAPMGAAQPTRRLATLDGGEPRLEQVEQREAAIGEVDITTAELLIAIGRGVPDQASIEQFFELAGLMGAALAASRPLVDAGWVDASRQVGQSGKTVKPKVYLAMGISGAAQHLAGIRDAGTVIAVNQDPKAAIFGVAQYGVVGDMFELAEGLARCFDG
jgi:electron transfer flavoprotein alpha subunit